MPVVTSAIFTLDSANSSLTLSGMVHNNQYGANGNITTQGTGSLTTHYSGSEVVQWDLSANTIQFVQANSSIMAANNGTWQPAPGGGSGSAPANYGAYVHMTGFPLGMHVDIYAAIRNLNNALFSNALSLSGSAGTYHFAGSGETIHFNTGTVDYNYSGAASGHGSTSLAGQNSPNSSSTQGTFQDLGSGNYRVTIPIHGQTVTNANGNVITLNSDGTLVGNVAMPTSFGVTGFPSPVTAGTAGTFTVTAKASNGSTATGYLGTVHFTSSDGQASLPGNYTFTVADNGVHSFSATLKTAATQSITATDTANGSITGSQSGIVVNPAAASSLTASGFPSPITAGMAGNITVTAKDPYGNIATGYTGTVHFTSSDTQAILPPDSTLTNGTGTFSATLKTAATQSITATDKANGSLTSTQSGIVVNPAALASFAVGGFPTPITAGTPGTFTVTAKDAYNNTVTGYTGTVHFRSGDLQASLPANYTFMATDNGTHTFSATLKTAGPQALLVATRTPGLILGGQAGIVVNPAAAATLIVAGFPTPITAGTPGTFTVTAKDVYNNTVTDYTGTVTFFSSDSQADLPAAYTFTAGDAGVHSFTATLNTAGPQVLGATDNSGLGGVQLRILVLAGPTTNLVVTDYLSPVIAGIINTFTVTAYDAYGNVATDYTGTVAFGSSDAAAELAGDYAFTTADQGTQTFTVVLNTVGTQSLIVTDIDNPDITGTQNGIAVVSANPLLAPPQGTAMDPVTVGVSAAVNQPASGILAAPVADSAGQTQAGSVSRPLAGLATQTLDSFYQAFSGKLLSDSNRVDAVLGGIA
jgi:hypothetical protein